MTIRKPASTVRAMPSHMGYSMGTGNHTTHHQP
jgi:hypothetical protein